LEHTDLRELSMSETPPGIVVGDDRTHRCWWCAQNSLYRDYHDQEWGFPVAEDRRLFEKLCLEGFQAGLSWLTILRKRENFRQAFDGFDFVKVAQYDESDVERLMGNAGIVRHRQKIEATINNARRTLEVIEECGSLANFVWRFEPDAASRPEQFTRAALSELTTTPASKRLAKELKARGFRFVGPTTAYAFMQAMGLVNDHVHGCDARRRVEEARRSLL
jgi:DNA-3-methyladenine glycosylase I